MLPTVERGIDAALHAEWVEARRAAFPDPKEINTFRDYARGVQMQTLQNIHTKWLRGLKLQFCKNVLKRVLVAVVDRIVFKNFVVADDAVAAYLERLVVLNAADLLFAQVIFTTWRDGNVGVALSFDNERRRVVLTRELFWNGDDGIFIAYDDKGNAIWSLREWKTAQGLRRTWQSNKEIRRYINNGNGWQWYGDTQAAGGVIYNTNDGKETGEPLGLMVVHFARHVEPADAPKSAKENQSDSNYGVSFLSGGLIGLQDALNDCLKMIASAARFTAFQILTATGVRPTKDKNGNDVSIKAEPGVMLTNENAAARYGAITAGAIDQLLLAKESWQEDIADVASVPIQSVKGNWPSGEAVFQINAPLIDQARKGGISMAPAFGSVGHKATVLENTYNGTAYDELALVGVLFYPPERYDPLTMTKLANERGANISLEEKHRLYGYSAEMSAKIIVEMQRGASFMEATAGIPGADISANDSVVEAGGVLDADAIAELAQMAAAELASGLPAPTSPTDPLPNALPANPGDAGTDADKTLNGAQINAALDVFDKLLGVGDGIRITELVAVELLKLVGVDRETAQRMVDDVLKNPSAARDVTNPNPMPDQTNGQ